MPLTRISLHRGKSNDYLKAVSSALHEALVETFDVPHDDRFQIIDQRTPGDLVIDPAYLGGPRSENFVLFEITAGKPRSTDVKRAFYRRLVTLLAQSPGLRPEDVMVIVTTTSSDSWSFANGVASMIEEAA